MDEMEKFKISESQRQSWVSLAAVWMGTMVCVPCFMIGGYLIQGFSFGSSILCIVVGYAIICAFMCFQGMQGCDTGLPTVRMASHALGESGARFLIGLLLAIACIGWFGVQAAVCGASFSGLLRETVGINIPNAVSGVFWGVVMFLTAMFGYNAVKYLNYVAVPALVLVMAYAFFAAVVRGGSAGAIAAYRPGQPMPLVAGINLVVATFAVGGVICGDFARFARSRKDVIRSSIIGVFPAGLVVLLVGAACSVAAGEYDVTKVLMKLGLPAISLVALVLATWTTNVTNAYSGGIAVSNFLGLGEDKFKIATGISGAVGTLLGAVGIIDRFIGFLNILTAFIPPIAGVMIAAYWIVGKGDKTHCAAVPGVNWTGMIAFAAGAAAAYVTGSVVPFFVAPINGIIVSIVVYTVAARFVPAKTLIRSAA